MKVLLRATDLRNENVLPLTKTREKYILSKNIIKTWLLVFFIPLHEGN